MESALGTFIRSSGPHVLAKEASLPLPIMELPTLFLPTRYYAQNVRLAHLVRMRGTCANCGHRMPSTAAVLFVHSNTAIVGSNPT
jgi:hypothetical protein